MPADVESIGAVLTDRAKEPGVAIRHGLSIWGVNATDRDVTVRAGAETFRSGWLVGCDGGRSAVRMAAGFGFTGTDPEFTGNLPRSSLQARPCWSPATTARRHLHAQAAIDANELKWRANPVLCRCSNGERQTLETSTDTLTRAQIAEAIHREVGMSRARALLFVEAIMARMAMALERGENVKITGFGTFVLNDKGERLGRNPKTGVEANIPARRVVTFKASEALRAAVARVPNS